MYDVINIGIILMLLMGGVVGAKRGAIKGLVMFLGIVLVLVLSYLLKNPLANLFYSIFPFINFGDRLSVVLNILFYEIIAFLLISCILLGVLNILIKCSSGIEKILKATIILGIPSKILGFFIGILEYYIIVFIALFILNMPALNLDLSKNSKSCDIILNHTVFLSDLFKNDITAYEDLTELKDKYKNNNEYNLKAIDIMLKTKIITVKSVDILIEKEKIKINNINKITEKYRRE